LNIRKNVSIHYVHAVWFDRASEDRSLIVLAFGLSRGHVDPGWRTTQHLELCVQSIAAQRRSLGLGRP